jgi:hypothetical protein
MKRLLQLPLLKPPMATTTADAAAAQTLIHESYANLPMADLVAAYNRMRLEGTPEVKRFASRAVAIERVVKAAAALA